MSKINGRPPKELLNKRVAIIHHRWLICKYLVLYFLCFVMLSLLVWLFTCLLVMVMVRGLEIVPLACTSNFPPWSCRDFRFRARLEIGSRLLHSRLRTSTCTCPPVCEAVLRFWQVRPCIKTWQSYRTGFWCTKHFRITFLESPGQTLQPWRQALKAERCTRIRRGDRGYRAHVGDRGDSGHGGHYRFEQDESLTKSATHSENAIKSI